MDHLQNDEKYKNEKSYTKIIRTWNTNTRTANHKHYVSSLNFAGAYSMSRMDSDVWQTSESSLEIDKGPRTVL